MTQSSLQGKTVLVTGATSGLGKQTALALARLGAHVVLVGRNPERGLPALAEVQAAGGTAELLCSDFSSLAEVRALASAFHARHPRLHVLVNNAGATYMQRRESADGHELTFAANHLAPFLLTQLLLPALKEAKAARVVNVSSVVHQTAQLDFDDLHSVKRYGGLHVYAKSKLANVLFTYELARRLEGSGVTANCLHPGIVATGFGQNQEGFFKGLFRFASPLFSSPEKGARTQVYLAASPQVEGVTGQYFVRCKQRRSSRDSRDPEVARRLWDESARLAGL
jgi:NAD(P)-dependent dehydrogenase (short-subunit alcohol dehydrogenase family)